MRSLGSPGQVIANLGFLLLSPLAGAVDTDGDGLDDNYETNTGNYISPSDTGTDPDNADTDNDTIPDGLDLPPGRNPLVVDWEVTTGNRHNCVRHDSGVVCWGFNSSGQTTVLSNPVAVSAGGNHSCALDDSGVVCWGLNHFGQTTVPLLSNPVAVTPGGSHTCALDDSGVVCGGAGTTVLGIQATDTGGVQAEYGQSIVPPLSNPVAVSAGNVHSCALDDSGVVCWGRNTEGQTTVPLLSNPVTVNASGDHSCALDDNGVVCWGFNHSGQTTVPVLLNPVAVSAAHGHSCALDDSGVVCWGGNYSGQTTVPLLSNPVAVGAGNAHSCALDESGVVCWGLDDDDQTTVPVLAFDKDRDGLLDDFEVDNGFNPLLGGEENLDTDTDGLTSLEEQSAGTSPTLADTDGDGLFDGDEVNTYATDPVNSDTDSDGLSDGDEVNTHATDPVNSDTDGDGSPDGLEVAAGTDPLDVQSTFLDVAGDINGDSQINGGDLVLGASILIGMHSPTEQEEARFDIAPLSNELPAPDEDINAGDYLILQRLILELISF
jgi:hypothetical protein